MARLIWPDSIKGESPPPMDVPALLETAVREWRPSFPLRAMAPMRVSAVPQSPKPAERTVEPDLMSATASSAESKIFDPPRFFAGALLGASRKKTELDWNVRFWQTWSFTRHAARGAVRTWTCTPLLRAELKERANSMLSNQYLFNQVTSGVEVRSGEIWGKERETAVIVNQARPLEPTSWPVDIIAGSEPRPATDFCNVGTAKVA